jgi:hypothetical protein
MPKKAVIKVELGTEAYKVWRDPVHVSIVVSD